VSSLLLSAQLLKDGAVGDLTPSQAEVVDMQLQDLERLENLMRDLLDVTKLAAGMTKLNFEPIAASELCRQVVKTMVKQASKQGVKVCENPESPDVVLEVDQGQISRVMINLIANAVRHTKSGGRVTVGARAGANDVTFYVEDTGEGIPKDYLSRIFDRFVQVPGATQGGAGLGLSIVGSIVNAHGGTVTARPGNSRGAVFTVTLPVADRTTSADPVLSSDQH